ncbi:MAG: hypothetical protein IT258_00340 [Saprospiraceae bacterium]|nr:hypothetical protein [Saprospiraceae bacterium]
MKKLLSDAIRLRGLRSNNSGAESKVWLNNTFLKLDKSLKIKAHSLNGFGWGDDEKGSLQLALAICIEIYPAEQVRHIYPSFCQIFLRGIQEDGFDLQIDLSTFNQSIKMD